MLFRSCEVTSTNLAANAATIGTGTWTQLPGGPSAAAFDNANSPNTAVTGLTYGDYVFRWTISNGNCTPTYDDVEVTISQQASNVFAGDDATICETDVPFEITGTADNATSTMWSTCANGCGEFSDPTNLTTTFTPTASDILNGFVILKLTAYSDEPCEPVEDQMKLTISKQAVVNAGIDVTLCEGEVYTCCCGISATNTTGILWTVNSEATGMLTNADLLLPTYTPGAGDAGNTVTLTLTGQSEDQCDVATDQMTITYNDLSAAITGFTNPTCEGFADGSATVTATGGSSSYTFDWAGTVTQASTTANPNKVTGLAPGTYIVTVTDADGCEAQEIGRASCRERV